MATLVFKVIASPDTASAASNKMFLNPEMKAKGEPLNMIKINNVYYSVGYNGTVPNNCIAMHKEHRTFHKKELNGDCELTFLKKPTDIPLPIVDLTLSVETTAKNVTINAQEFINQLQETLLVQPLNQNQRFSQSYNGTGINVQVVSINMDKSTVGMLNATTEITLVSSSLQLSGQAETSSSLFKINVNLEELGIGGLDEEFATMFRKAFASRAIPKKVIELMGIKHTKGILLYGPPGTGKTLVARKIGEILKCHEPKIVNGPELLNKWVGGSEENVRKLFADAESDKNESELHLIIIDEIDALCKQRGSSKDSSGVSDNIVNQFLSKIDGAKQLNNVLIIGMTNRPDLIDDAIKRPGRLEVHIEISLPDESGRQQILKIHSKGLRQNGFLAKDVDLTPIASTTRNYTGAELESVVKNAAGFAMVREVSINDNHVDMKKEVHPIVTQNDFLRAVDEMQPMFGKASEEITELNKTKFLFWSEQLVMMDIEIRQKIAELNTGFISKMLLWGPAYIGKTKFVANVIKSTGISCVRIITPEKLLRIADRAGYIYNSFLQCSKAETSVLILDGFERIVEWASLGSRFNNTVLQTVLSLLDAQLKSNKKMAIFITANSLSVLDDLELTQCFDSVYDYPSKITADELQLLDPEYAYLDDRNIDVSKVFKLMKYKTQASTLS